MTELVVVRDSTVHGRGVFARVDIGVDEHIGYYEGELISSAEADRRHAEAGSPAHTMLFSRDDGMVIDGSSGGNLTRFINHGCVPNCHAEEYDDGTIGIVTSAPLRVDDELFIDYQLQIDPADSELYPCRCGAAACRGTMAAG